MKKKISEWTVYILELNDRTYYTGITNNLKARLKTHADGKGSKLVRSKLPFVLRYTEEAKNRSVASKREAAIKKLTRKEKESLVQMNNFQVDKIYLTKEEWEDILKCDKQLKEQEMSFPIQPTFDNVFVKKDDTSVDKNSGLFLPDSVKGRAKTGTIVAIGPGYLDLVTGKFIPTTLKVGDRVFVKEFTGYRVDYKEHQVFVFQEKEIIGKLLDE